ncbi:hypothetical protein [Flavobacterium sp. SM2513]|uniref:hypothetical protein n=1 Tax=Flavobacterium sp. SM2513 TaxID=3424766 RepID=UPI003D7FCC91
MTINKLTKIALTVVLLFGMNSVFAQFPEDPDPDTDPEDGALDPAPISDYLIPMLVIGVATAFILLKKKELVVKNN